MKLQIKKKKNIRNQILGIFKLKKCIYARFFFVDINFCFLLLTFNNNILKYVLIL